MPTNKSYDPLKNYGNDESKKPYGSSGGTSSSTPLLGRQVLGSPNFWKIAAVLDGDKDEHFRHTITTDDLANDNFVMAFPHGLSFIPTVEGSYTFGNLEVQSPRHPLPHNGYVDNISYINKPPSWHVEVDSVDKTNMYIRFVLHDGVAVSTFVSNSELFFKFYCFQDSTI